MPFDAAGLRESWKSPATGEWIRTFAVITTDANELVAGIHARMPLILAPEDYVRWLVDEPDPANLMRPFPAEPMWVWPISTRVNKPVNECLKVGNDGLELWAGKLKLMTECPRDVPKVPPMFSASRGWDQTCKLPRLRAARPEVE
jgi:hypothetical protein